MFDIKIDDKALMEKLTKMGNNSGRVAEEIVKNVGTIAHKSARSHVPVDTGALKGSISLGVSQTGETSEAVIATNLEYANSIEYGTSKQASQPFMRPAVGDAQKHILKVAREVLKKYD